MIEIDLPKEFVESIDEYIKNHPEKGYDDRDEFVSSAIRQFIYENPKNFSRNV